MVSGCSELKKNFQSQKLQRSDTDTKEQSFLKKGRERSRALTFLKSEMSPNLGVIDKQNKKYNP